MLHVHLQEGFNDDDVELRVDGRLELRHRGVTTRLLTGYADQISVDLPDGHHEIDVRVPTRSMSSEFSVALTGDLWVGLSVEAGRLVRIDSTEPFAYL
jgi:hypothetical protein